MAHYFKRPFSEIVAILRKSPVLSPWDINNSTVPRNVPPFYAIKAIEDLTPTNLRGSTNYVYAAGNPADLSSAMLTELIHLRVDFKEVGLGKNLADIHLGYLIALWLKVCSNPCHINMLSGDLYFLPYLLRAMAKGCSVTVGHAGSWHIRLSSHLPRTSIVDFRSIVFTKFNDLAIRKEYKRWTWTI